MVCMVLKSCANNETRPADGLRMRLTHFNNVVLPAPLTPKMDTNSLDFISIFRFWRTSLFGQLKERFSTDNNVFITAPPSTATAGT